MRREERKNMKFTEDDLDNCWPYFKSYFIDILNNEYDLNKARSDLETLIGSDFDLRKKDAPQEEEAVSTDTQHR